MQLYRTNADNMRNRRDYATGARSLMRDASRRTGRPGARQIMRDITPRGPSNNAMGVRSALTQFGWIGPAIGMMGNSARWACSLNPDNEVIAASGYPLETLATTPSALLNASMIACAGSAGKTITTALWPAVPAATTLDLTANTSIAFGARVKLSASITNFAFGTYEIQLAQGVTVLSYIFITVVSLPVDIIILAINDNAGKATIVGDNAPAVIFPYSIVPGAIGNANAGSMNSSTVLYAETINMRDIGNIWDAVEHGAVRI